MLTRRWGYYSPWREAQRLRREMNRLLTGMPTGSRWRTAPAFPAMNVWTDEDHAMITAELPGVDKESLDISVEGDTLTLRGNCPAPETEEGATFHRRERGCGSFARTVELPFNVESEGVEATLEQGLLRISLPRAEEDKPKKITVKAG